MVVSPKNAIEEPRHATHDGPIVDPGDSRGWSDLPSQPHEQRCKEQEECEIHIITHASREEYATKEQ
jgi:hypothetical protein